MWIESEQLRVECLVVSKVVRVLGIEHRSRIVGARGVNQDLPRHAHQRTRSRSMLICYCASKAPYISVLERKYLSQNHFFWHEEYMLREDVAISRDKAMLELASPID